MKRLLSTALVLTALPISANAQDWTLSASLDAVSEYNFRGVTRAGNAVQAGLEAGYKNLYIGAWGSSPIGSNSDVFPEEINLYAGFEYELSEFVSGELGATLYHYPQSGSLTDFGRLEASTVELYGSLHFNTILAPAFTAYYDAHLESVTLETEVSYGVDVSSVIELGGELSAGLVDTDLGQSYSYGGLEAGVYYRPHDFLEWRLLANIAASSEETFLDTDFDLSDPATLKAPEQQGAWVSTGVTFKYD